MPKCPKCDGKMVKAEKDITLLVAGAYAKLLGLQGHSMEETIYIKAGELYCPTCTKPAKR